MSKTSLFLLAGIILIFLISLAIIFRRPPTPITTSKVVQKLMPQENSGGEVDVKVTPLVLKVGEKPQFRLEFNTHSVELDFDVIKVVSLATDRGPLSGEISWDGNPPGGHHREGILTFSSTLKSTSSVNLILRDISGIPKREFTWQI